MCRVSAWFLLLARIPKRFCNSVLPLQNILKWSQIPIERKPYYNFLTIAVKYPTDLCKKKSLLLYPPHHPRLEKAKKVSSLIVKI